MPVLHVICGRSGRGGGDARDGSMASQPLKMMVTSQVRAVWMPVSNLVHSCARVRRPQGGGGPISAGQHSTPDEDIWWQAASLSPAGSGAPPRALAARLEPPARDFERASAKPSVQVGGLLAAAPGVVRSPPLVINSVQQTRRKATHVTTPRMGQLEGRSSDSWLPA